MKWKRIRPQPSKLRELSKNLTFLIVLDKAISKEMLLFLLSLKFGSSEDFKGNESPSKIHYVFGPTNKQASDKNTFIVYEYNNNEFNLGAPRQIWGELYPEAQEFY